MVNMQKLLQQFEVHLSRPERYLIGSDELKNKCLELNQELFSHCNSGRFPAGPLRTLHAKRFDNDQVWEQIQLLNRPTVKYAKKRRKEIGKMTSGYSAVLPQVVDDLNHVHDQSETELLSESSLSSEDHPRRTSASGDNFFSISEMNQFLQEEDRKHESSQVNQLPLATVDDFDLFREISEDEGDQLVYDDFFDPPNDFDHHDDHGIHDIDGSDYEVHDHNFDNDTQHQSTHQRQQQKVTCKHVKFVSSTDQANVVCAIQNAIFNLHGNTFMG